MDDSKPAGSYWVMKIGIRIGSDGVSFDALHEIVEWAEKHSPLVPFTRVMPIEYTVDVV